MGSAGFVSGNAYRKKTMIRYLTAAILAAFVLSGCSFIQNFFKDREDVPADELVSQGMYEFEDGDYRDAIEAFQKLRDFYPFSKYVILAELKIADAHFRLKEFEEAAAAYEQFESLHPTNEAIPYIIYQIGSCYFERIETVDRDQTATRNALEAYRRLIRHYPDDEYARKAESRVIACQKNLAGHEFYVGEYYFKEGQYKAALSRFKSVVTDFPDVGIQQRALVYIAQCEDYLARDASSSDQERNKGRDGN